MSFLDSINPFSSKSIDANVQSINTGDPNLPPEVKAQLAQQQAFAQALQGQQGLTAQNQANLNQAALNSQLAAGNGAQNLASGADRTNTLSSQANAINGIGHQQESLGDIATLQRQQAANNGVANQANVFNQMQNVANGTGPNPAQNQLNQATGNNIQQQAALMASQRGGGANAGLMARQAAMQGAGIQQQAAGQAATLGAQQQLGALGQLGGLANTQVSQQQQQQMLQQQAAQQQVANQLASNQAAVNAGAQQVNLQQQGINSGFQQGATQVGQQQAGLNANVQGMNQATANQNQANVAMQSNVNDSRTKLAGQSNQQKAGVLGGAMNALGSALPLLGKAGSGMQMGQSQNPTDSLGGGGEGDGPVSTPAPNVGGASAGSTDAPQSVPAGGRDVSNMVYSGGMAHNGQIMHVKNYDMGGAVASDPGAPQSSFGKYITGYTEGFKSPTADASSNNIVPPQSSGGSAGGMGGVLQSLGSGIAGGGGGMMGGGGMFAQGGQVPAMVSPGEVYIPPQQMEQVKRGKDPIQAGEKIPGKAKVKGNSLKNDTVPATLEEGGVVLPKSVMESKHPHWAAHKFVSALMAKQQLKKGK